MEKSFGQRIYELRKAKELTQEQLAEQLNVSPQAVSKWENDLACPDIMLLKPLSEILGISVGELLGEEKKETVKVANPGQLDIANMLLRIKVLSKKGDKVSVNLPVSLIETLMESDTLMANIGLSGDSLKNIDFKHILRLIHSGVIGKLVDVQSAEGDIVEIWVE